MKGKSEAAATLGRRGRGKPKTMTPAAIAARRDNIKAAIAKRWQKKGPDESNSNRHDA